MRYQHNESLTPEETQAFLEIHAEREAHGPRPSDLAETLGLSPEETREILAQARNRVAGKSRFDLRPWTVSAGAIAGIFAIALFIVQPPRSAPVLTTSPATRTPAGSRQPLPLVQPSAASTPAPLETEAPSARIPDGFEISIQVSGSQTYATEPMAKTVPDYAAVSELEGAQVRADLVEATLKLIDTASTNPGAWMRAPELWVNLRLHGRAWTLVKVPIRPYTLPLTGNPEGREDLRQTLSALYRAGWKDILRANPSG